MHNAVPVQREDVDLLDAIDGANEQLPDSVAVQVVHGEGVVLLFPVRKHDFIFRISVMDLLQVGAGLDELPVSRLFVRKGAADGRDCQHGQHQQGNDLSVHWFRSLLSDCYSLF